MDTKPEVFACLLNWVFTRVFEIEKKEKSEENILKAIEVYTFADKYESAQLRRIVFDKIATAVILNGTSWRN